MEEDICVLLWPKYVHTWHVPPWECTHKMALGMHRTPCSRDCTFLARHLYSLLALPIPNPALFLMLVQEVLILPPLFLNSQEGIC